MLFIFQGLIHLGSGHNHTRAMHLSGVAAIAGDGAKLGCAGVRLPPPYDRGADLRMERGVDAENMAFSQTCSENWRSVAQRDSMEAAAVY